MNDELILKYVRGVTSDDENKRMEEWMQEDAQNEALVSQTFRLYHAQKTRRRIDGRDPYAAYEKVWRKSKRKKTHFFHHRFLKVAACAALVVSLCFNSAVLLKERERGTQYVTVQTNAGMRTQFDLPDGTIVYLNSASSLTYPVPYDRKERRVSLTGEGYFDVVSSPTRPFIVSLAGEIEVEAFGTTFNVQAYPSDETVKTTLVNGAVQLREKGKVITRLHPSERSVYHTSSRLMNIATVETLHDTAWRNGMLIFRDTPLSEVLERLSHFYNVDFEVENPVINSYFFTGTFRERQLSQILDYVSISSHIKYRIVYPEEDDGVEAKRTKVYLTDVRK
jgi:ferric-dicitrate binding protein FerR (iron transport regulator)